MKTTYDLYHWPHPGAAASIVSTHPSAALAADASGHPDGPAWAAVDWEADGRMLDPGETGGKRTWGIFARQVAETDAERITLALTLISSYSQDDGAHHKAWVIDQVTRILTGDGYHAWITAYCAGDYGPESYPWDTGIAP